MAFQDLHTSSQKLRLLLLLALLFLSPCYFAVPNSALAAGQLRVSSGLLDSESRAFWAPRPQLSLSLRGEHEGWKGWLGARLLPDAIPPADRPQGSADRFVVELTRAEAWRRFGDAFVAGGRMELRPFSIPLHQGNQGFLRDVTRMDGVSAGYHFTPLHVQLFGGAPLEAGVVLGFEPEGIKLMASYTYRDDAVAQVPASLGIGNVVWSQRSFDSHEWELAAVTSGDTIAVSGVFQGRHSGEMRFADAANPRAAATPGAVDTALPRTSADYRALTQVSVLLSESGAGDGELWLAFAAGGASAPRFHAGTTEEILRRQGGGNQLFLGVSLEEIWSKVRAQGGFTLAQTSTPSYLWLNKRDDRGALELSKSRVRGWIAVFLDF